MSFFMQLPRGSPAVPAGPSGLTDGRHDGFGSGIGCAAPSALIASTQATGTSRGAVLLPHYRSTRLRDSLALPRRRQRDQGIGQPPTKQPLQVGPGDRPASCDRLAEFPHGSQQAGSVRAVHCRLPCDGAPTCLRRLIHGLARRRLHRPPAVPKAPPAATPVPGRRDTRTMTGGPDTCGSGRFAVSFHSYFSAVCQASCFTRFTSTFGLRTTQCGPMLRIHQTISSSPSTVQRNRIDPSPR